MSADGNWADERELALHCRGSETQAVPCSEAPRHIPTCGRIPQSASRIGCLVTGDVGGGQEETGAVKGMKMTSVRKSAGRGRRETEREREDVKGSKKEVKKEDRK